MKIEIEFKTALFLFAVFAVAIVAWRYPKDLANVLCGMAITALLAGFFWMVSDL